MKEYLEKRIKELKEADAKFCNDRWGENIHPLVKKMARENSNSVTLARQELERALDVFNKLITPDVIVPFICVHKYKDNVCDKRGVRKCLNCSKLEQAN